MDNELEEQNLVFTSAKLHEKKFDDQKKTVESVITSESMDRDKDIVSRDGIQYKRFKENPMVLFNHDWDKIIGKSLRLTKKVLDNGQKGLHAVTQFAPTEFAQELYQLAKDGFLNAWSIGFISLERETRSDEKGIGFMHLKTELLEYSAVSVPSNSDALTLRKLFKALPDYSKNTQKELTNGLDLNLADELAQLSAEIDEMKANFNCVAKTLVAERLANKIEQALKNGQRIDPDSIEKQLKKDYGIWI